MSHQVRTNKPLVDLPGVGRIEASGTTVTLTDQDFTLIPASAFTGGSPILTDLGVLAESGDAVVNQAAHVANAPALTAPADLGATYTQANVNALRTDVAALQTTLNAVLAALQANGCAMKSS